MKRYNYLYSEDFEEKYPEDKENIAKLFKKFKDLGFFERLSLRHIIIEVNEADVNNKEKKTIYFYFDNVEKEDIADFIAEKLKTDENIYNILKDIIGYNNVCFNFSFKEPQKTDDKKMFSQTDKLGIDNHIENLQNYAAFDGNNETSNISYYFFMDEKI